MKFLRCLLCCAVMGCGLGTAATPKLGTRSSDIGTFDGWTFWVGWEGSFSDTYAPEKEKYTWNVFFAPEAVYVALLAQQAVYSGVDVNMGIKYFYGFLRAPNGAATLNANYVSDLWSVSFSIGYPDAVPPVGVMSQLSLGFEIEQAFFRVKNTRKILPGIQWGAGYSASFSLLTISLPFTVELDRDWKAPPVEPAPSLFWPVAIWNRTANPAQHPIDQIHAALTQLGSSGIGGATSGVMGEAMRPLMDRLAADQDLRAFISNPTASTRIQQAMAATETWLVTSDTKNLPEALRPMKGHQEVKDNIHSILCVTQLAFETGYRVGAQANTNNRTVYVDGVVTNYAVPGEKVTLEVPVAELVEAIPGRQASEFEGTWVGFDTPIEAVGSYDALGKVEWVQVSNGAARFTLAQSLSTPQLLGVRYDDDANKPLNGGRDVELKRRLILFVDAADTNQNRIPDFWENQYRLSNSTGDSDQDRDGLTDYQEYIVGTHPTNAQSVFALSLDRKQKELVLPFASNVRFYVIEVNTGSLSRASDWVNVMEFMGSDQEERIDLTDVFQKPRAFFRVRVTKP